VALKRTSLEARLALAMEVLFRTEQGAVLHEYLTRESQTLSRVAAGGVIRDQVASDINEGRRFLAIELLGAPANIADIEGGQ
jgi:hypothetical protein